MDISYEAELELFRSECKSGDIVTILYDLQDKQIRTMQGMSWIAKEKESAFRTKQLIRFQEMLDLIQMKYTIVYMEFVDKINAIPYEEPVHDEETQKLIDNVMTYIRIEGRKLFSEEISQYPH